jgi:hypothetical protein
MRRPSGLPCSPAVPAPPHSRYNRKDLTGLIWRSFLEGLLRVDWSTSTSQAFFVRLTAFTATLRLSAGNWFVVTQRLISAGDDAPIARLNMVSTEIHNGTPEMLILNLLGDAQPSLPVRGAPRTSTRRPHSEPRSSMHCGSVAPRGWNSRDKVAIFFRRCSENAVSASL